MALLITSRNFNAGHCDACGHHRDSVIHRVVVCPALLVPRKVLKNSLALIDPSLRVSLDVLLNWSARSFAVNRKMVLALCSFLTSSGLENLFLWNPGVVWVRDRLSKCGACLWERLATQWPLIFWLVTSNLKFLEINANPSQLQTLTWSSFLVLECYVFVL